MISDWEHQPDGLIYYETNYWYCMYFESYISMFISSQVIIVLSTQPSLEADGRVLCEVTRYYLNYL